MDYFPGLGPALSRLSGADKLMASVADFREAQCGRRTSAMPGPHSRVSQQRPTPRSTAVSLELASGGP
jgi:hypothetical protein